MPSPPALAFLRRHPRLRAPTTRPVRRIPFYAKYLNTGSTLDAQITRTLNALRQNPDSAELHNSSGHAAARRRAFRRTPSASSSAPSTPTRSIYPAWYNLGLVRAVTRRWISARTARFARTVALKPGHAPALFQLGLVEEKRNHHGRAIDYYAKAFTINPSLLRRAVNPRILDSKLIDLALLKVYPKEHARESMSFQATPPGYVQQGLEAASTQPAAKDIVTPAPPLTDPSMQAPPPTAGTPVQPAPQPAKPPL